MFYVCMLPVKPASGWGNKMLKVQWTHGPAELPCATTCPDS